MALFDLLGRTWAMGIVWQLYDGPQTFRGLQERCDGISAALLNTRLKELRVTGLVTRCEQGYVLTELGAGLSTLLRPMEAWARQWERELPPEEDSP
jgi:DNA-binding HxlR family transcriptional regulator